MTEQPMVRFDKVTKRYGPTLLGGLPRAERVVGPWTQVRTKCEDFFARHGIGAIV